MDAIRSFGKSISRIGRKPAPVPSCLDIDVETMNEPSSSGTSNTDDQIKTQQVKANHLSNVTALLQSENISLASLPPAGRVVFTPPENGALSPLERKELTLTAMPGDTQEDLNTRLNSILNKLNSIGIEPGDLKQNLSAYDSLDTQASEAPPSESSTENQDATAATPIMTPILKEMMGNLDYYVDTFRNELHDPRNWSFSKKLAHTVLYGVTTLVSQYNSAAMSPILSDVESSYGVSYKCAALTTCLYILGIGFGPLIFAPMSEVYGRKVATLLPFFLAGCFSLAATCSYNYYSLIFFRFLCGVCSASPIVVGGGMLADIWEPDVRSSYMVIYSNFVTLGPCLSPLIGGILLHASKNWRVTMYFSTVLYFGSGIVNIFCISESCKMVLLANEAKELRNTTGNRLYHSEMDSWTFSMEEFIHKHVKRPLKMMTSPVIFSVSCYASFVFGVYYLVATSVSSTFREHRGLDTLTAGAPMMAAYIGAAIAGIPANILSSQRYSRLIKANNGVPLPEERLVAVMFLGAILPIGILTFGYTVSVSEVHWVVPCIGLGMMGAGFFIIFQGCLNYLLDAFPKYSASAIAVSTAMRSVFAGFFPLFSKEIFHSTGIEVGCLSIALVAILCLPMPFIIYAKGLTARRKAKFNW